MAGKPLLNRKIAVTRAEEQAGDFAEILSGFGAETIHLPVIEIDPLEIPEEVILPEKINRYSWIVFTSSNGAALFLEDLKKSLSPDELQPGICAIGPGTARTIEHLGFRVSLVPRLFQAEGIIEALENKLTSLGKRASVLIPRASRAREILPDTIRKMGFHVDVLPVYQTIFPSAKAPRLRSILKSSKIDMVTFTSSSTVTNFMRLVVGYLDPNQFRYSSIGPITSKTAEDSGLRISVVAEESTLESLAQAMADYFAAES